MSDRFINLLVYGDSVAFRRIDDPQDFAVTYPFKLKELIERELKVRVNLLLRGRGGADIRAIEAILVRDTGFLAGAPGSTTIAVLQFGIVDCAPRPFTYVLTPGLRLLPLIGQPVLSQLVQHRRGLQKLWSYTVTTKRDFWRRYTGIVNVCHGSGMKPVAVGMPLPPISMEQRSPGFRRSTALFNDIIRDVIPESFCDVEASLTESLRESILRSDGHHLTEAGHRLYADLLLERVRKLV